MVHMDRIVDLMIHMDRIYIPEVLQGVGFQGGMQGVRMSATGYLRECLQDVGPLNVVRQRSGILMVFREFL